MKAIIKTNESVHKFLGASFLRQALIFFPYLFICLSAFGAPEPSLQEELQVLKLDEKQIPAEIPREKYYALQSRYNELTNRFEFSIGGGKNFSPSPFLTSQEIEGDVHYYFNDRFYTALSASYVFNSLSDAGNALWQNHIAYPDIAPVRYRSDLTFGYHLFYGKFRLTMDSVFYFDQYWALGAGVIGMDNGINSPASPALVADAGFSLWIGRQWSLRIGLKDEYFKEVRRIESSGVQHFIGHLSMGFLLGGDGV